MALGVKEMEKTKTWGGHPPKKKWIHCYMSCDQQRIENAEARALVKSKLQEAKLSNAYPSPRPQIQPRPQLQPRPQIQARTQPSLTPVSFVPQSRLITVSSAPQNVISIPVTIDRENFSQKRPRHHPYFNGGGRSPSREIISSQSVSPSSCSSLDSQSMPGITTYKFGDGSESHIQTQSIADTLKKYSQNTQITQGSLGSTSPYLRANGVSKTPHTREFELKEEAAKAIKGRSGLIPSREVHNKLEKNRRAHLKECFEILRKQLPYMEDKKISNQTILKAAQRYILTLKRKEREHEHEMERLSNLKIAFHQRLKNLKGEIQTKWAHIDIENICKEIAKNFEHRMEKDSKSTATATEQLPDFEDVVVAGYRNGGFVPSDQNQPLNLSTHVQVSQDNNNDNIGTASSAPHTILLTNANNPKVWSVQRNFSAPPTPTPTNSSYSEHPTPTNFSYSEHPTPTNSSYSEHVSNGIGFSNLSEQPEQLKVGQSISPNVTGGQFQTFSKVVSSNIVHSARDRPLIAGPRSPHTSPATIVGNHIAQMLKAGSATLTPPPASTQGVQFPPQKVIPAVPQLSSISNGGQFSTISYATLKNPLKIPLTSFPPLSSGVSSLNITSSPNSISTSSISTPKVIYQPGISTSTNGIITKTNDKSIPILGAGGLQIPAHLLTGGVHLNSSGGLVGQPIQVITPDGYKLLPGDQNGAKPLAITLTHAGGLENLSSEEGKNAASGGRVMVTLNKNGLSTLHLAVSKNITSQGPARAVSTTSGGIPLNLSVGTQCISTDTTKSTNKSTIVPSYIPITHANGITQIVQGMSLVGPLVMSQSNRGLVVPPTSKQFKGSPEMGTLPSTVPNSSPSAHAGFLNSVMVVSGPVSGTSQTTTSGGVASRVLNSTLPMSKTHY